MGKQTSLKDELIAGALANAMQRRQQTMNEYMGPLQTPAITPQQALQLFS